MSSKIPDALYPVALIQDRYQGVYCDGEWLAVAAVLTRKGGSSRASWVLEFGPYANDLMAGMFWADAPDWIASGRTPDAAIEALLKKNPILARQTVT